MFGIAFGKLWFQERQKDGSHLWSPRRLDAMPFETWQEASAFLAEYNLTVGALVVRL